MTYKIQIHSFIDVITNSSTEIFITTNKKALEFAKSLVDKILKLAKVNGSFDDFFTIEYVNNIWDMEDILSRSIQSGDDDLFKLFNESELAITEGEKKGDYWRISSALIEHWSDLIPKNIEEYLLSITDDEENRVRRYLIIHSKDETNEDIIHLNEEFEKIFDAYESYQG